MLCSTVRNVIAGFALFAVLSTTNVARSQTVNILPLSNVAMEGSYDVSPDGKGVVFLGNGAGQADYLLVINNDIENASMLSISPDGSFLQPSSFGEYAFSAPLVKGKDGVFSVSFVAVPAMDRGTGSEVSATNQWSSNNSAWFAGRFGFGWQDSFGEWLAANVLIPVVGVENLAGASDTVLIVGTVGVAIAVVAGGEVVLGVGTLGGGGAAAAAGGGGLTTAAAEAEATRRYINLIGNAVRTGKDLVRRDPTDFL